MLYDMLVYDAQNYNPCWDISQSKFDCNLQQKHLAEAHAWVLKCRKMGITPLNSCGERGDLFFLIQSNPWLLTLGTE